MRFAKLVGAIVMILFTSPSSRAATPDIWLAPPDDVTQHTSDFHGFFDTPNAWSQAAKHVSVFVITQNYLLRKPASVVRRELQFLKDHGLKLAVGVGVLPADKHVCGDGIEGMSWPHEAALTAKRLKALGADVAYFTFDLPLIAGHVTSRGAACRFSVAETARRLAQAAGELKAVYPNAKLIDLEVPTGMPLQTWVSMLREWLAAYRQASGMPFDGFTMDAWWEFDWKDAVRQTTQILHDSGIPAGIFIDADGKPGMTGAAGFAQAKANACALQKTGIPLDYYQVANWMIPNLPSLPETTPASLTALVNDLANGRVCSP